MRTTLGLKLLAAAWLAALGGAASAQDINVAPNWENPTDALPHPRQAAIGVPREAGSHRLTELSDFNDSGGLDNIAQYRLPDSELFATLYIYRTTLADPAIASIATDTVIRARFGSETRPASDTIVSAGGHDGVARRILYEAPEAATLAAFLRAGPWTVKLRVSGPAAARDEVEAVADAILAGLTFGEGLIPPPFEPYELTACPVEPGGALARHIELQEDRARAATLGAALTVAGRIVDRSLSIPEGTSGTRLCAMASRAAAPSQYVTALRRTDHDADIDFLLVGDSGRAFELLLPPSESWPGYHLAFHTTAEATIFGPFNRAPSVDQLMAVVTGGDASWLGNPVARVALEADGGTVTSLHTPPAGGAR